MFAEIPNWEMPIWNKSIALLTIIIMPKYKLLTSKLGTNHGIDDVFELALDNISCKLAYIKRIHILKLSLKVRNRKIEKIDKLRTHL